MIALERYKGRRRLGHNQAIGRGRDLGAAEAIRQGDHPERKGEGAENVRAAAPVGSARQSQPDNLGRAPADVENKGIGDAGMQQWSAARDDEARLLAARDDLDLEPDLFVHPGKKSLAISRAAAGLGGDVATGFDFSR